MLGTGHPDRGYDVLAGDYANMDRGLELPPMMSLSPVQPDDNLSLRAAAHLRLQPKVGQSPAPMMRYGEGLWASVSVRVAMFPCPRQHPA